MSGGSRNNYSNTSALAYNNSGCSSSSSSSSSSSTSSVDKKTANNTSTNRNLNNNQNGEEATLTMNPFLNDFIDCIENLPNKLQLLLSELRSVDALANARHKKIQAIKQEILNKTSGSSSSRSTNSESSVSSYVCSNNSLTIMSDDETTSPAKVTEASRNVMKLSSLTIDQLLLRLHQVLIQCQELGDQKVRLTGQVMDILSSKTRQLGLDTKSLEERKFNIELDEEKIISEFKLAIKNRSMHSHYHSQMNNHGTTSHRTSTRNCHANNSSSKIKQPTQLNSAEINKAVSKYITNSKSIFNNANSHAHQNQNNHSSLSMSSQQPMPTSNIDAYSFDEPNQMVSSPFSTGRFNSNGKSSRNGNNSGLQNSVTTGKKTGNSKNSKLHNISSIQSGSCKKGAKNTTSYNNNNRGLDSQPELTNNFKNSAKLNDSSSTSMNRPKRQLNYSLLNNDTATSLSKSKSKQANLANNNASKVNMTASARKKQRLMQQKGVNLLTQSTQQCKSPSSSSTSSSTTKDNLRKLNRYENNPVAKANTVGVSNKHNVLTNGNMNTRLNKQLKDQQDQQQMLKTKHRSKKLMKKQSENVTKRLSDKVSKRLSGNLKKKRLINKHANGRNNVNMRNSNESVGDDAENNDSHDGDIDADNHNGDEENEEIDDNGDLSSSSTSTNSMDADDMPSSTIKKSTSRQNRLPFETGSNFNIDYSPMTECLNSAAAPKMNDERNSNETESINHIDDDDDEECGEDNDEEDDENILNDCDDDEDEDDDEGDEDEEDDEDDDDLEGDDGDSSSLNQDNMQDVMDFDEDNNRGEPIAHRRNANRETDDNDDERIDDDDDDEEEDNDEANSDTDMYVNKQKQSSSYRGNSKHGAYQNGKNQPLAETISSNHYISAQQHEDEPLYCTCQEISYGQMICCDNDACQIEWFHFTCVNLTSKPKGKWYCPNCRGDTHKVMKKVVQLAQIVQPNSSTTTTGNNNVTSISSH